MPDLNIAFNAFANNYPNKIKYAGGSGFIAHTERISGNYLVMYELENDWTWIVSRYRKSKFSFDCLIFELRRHGGVVAAMNISIVVSSTHAPFFVHLASEMIRI